MHTRKQGFATLSDAQRKVLSAKGGRAKVKKGFAMLTPEQRSEMGKYASKIRLAKKEKSNHEYSSIN